jgi:hypothetical protein
MFKQGDFHLILPLPPTVYPAVSFRTRVFSAGKESASLINLNSRLHRQEPARSEFSSDLATHHNPPPSHVIPTEAARRLFFSLTP